MVKAKLSSKFQVVIPKSIRQKEHLKSGEEFTVLAKDGIITFIPQHSLKNLRGILKGMKADNLREAKDRL
jgi:AbrB family looped-hinge helix DNA binding protein